MEIIHFTVLLSILLLISLPIFNSFYWKHRYYVRDHINRPVHSNIFLNSRFSRKSQLHVKINESYSSFLSHDINPTFESQYESDLEFNSSPLSSPSSSSSFVSTAISQLKLEFNCDVIDSDELSEMILELGPLSVSVEGMKEKENILNDESKWEDLQKTKSWATAVLCANFPSSFDIQGVIDAIHEMYPNQTYGEIIENVQNVDWMTEIQKNWKPQIIDDLMIKFPWHEKENIPSFINYELVLEGGAAFGTGDHPTTTLCTRWISRMVKSIKRNRAQSISVDNRIRVLDYGCGSGILGLVALRYGAEEAIGVDIDKDALVSAYNNCQLNQLPMKLYITGDSNNGSSDNDDESISSISHEEKAIRMNIFRGNAAGIKDFEEERVGLYRQEFDITVANILAPILIQLAPILSTYTKSGGMIGLSGVVNKQADIVCASYAKYFDNVKVESVEGDWVLITGRKP